jgi:hypothetical protein
MQEFDRKNAPRFDPRRSRRTGLGELVSRSWLVPAVEAEDAVLDEWAELHGALLGYPPSG